MDCVAAGGLAESSASSDGASPRFAKRAPDAPDDRFPERPFPRSSLS